MFDDDRSQPQSLSGSAKNLRQLALKLSSPDEMMYLLVPDTVAQGDWSDKAIFVCVWSGRQADDQSQIDDLTAPLQASGVPVNIGPSRHIGTCECG